MSFNRKMIAGLMAASVLTGCSTSESLTQVKESRGQAEELLSAARQPMAPANISQVKTTDQPYLDAVVNREDHGDPLPSRWDSNNFNVATARPAGFHEIAIKITEITGIQVGVSGLSAGKATTGNAAASAPSQQARSVPSTSYTSPAPLGLAQSVGGPNPTQSGPLGAAQAALAPGVRQATPVSAPPLLASEQPSDDLGISDRIQGKMKLSYNGKLKGFLDQVASYFNLNWEYSQGRIVFSKYLTRTFEVAGLPGKTSLSFSMSSGSDVSSSSGSGNGASAKGGTDQQAKTEAEFAIWKEISENLAAIIGSDGLIQPAPQQGMVTVVATPSSMQRVSTYIKSVNQSLSKQVVMSVKVYSVALTDSDDYASDMNLLFNKAGAFGLRLSTAGTSGTVDGSTTIPQATSQGMGWAILNSTGQVTGNGIFKALATKGDVSVVTSASVTTINGQPVPFQVANTRGYLAKVTTTTSTSTSSGNQTSLEPGSVTTGFNLHLLPHIQKDGGIMLQYGMNISELVGSQNGFETYTSGGSSIQLPNVNQRNFIQQAILPNNSTLVLAGFEQVKSSASKSGNFSSSLWPLGGLNSSAMKREILVITITPTILDRQNPRSLATENL